MTFQTHKQFAIGWIYLGALIIYRLNISNVNYYLMLIIMLSVGKIGALFPDVDHHWKSVKEKNTFNWIINKIIHLTGGKHRSWQTHSWDICIIFTVASYTLNVWLFKESIISEINFEVASLIFTGFNIGWISHLFSDMLTSDGVRLFCFLKFKIAFVPKSMSKSKAMLTSLVVAGTGVLLLIAGLKIGIILILVGLTMFILAIRLGNIRFNTGNEWEAFVYKVSRTLNVIIGATAMLYPWVVLPQFKDIVLKIISRN